MNGWYSISAKHSETFAADAHAAEGGHSALLPFLRYVCVPTCVCIPSHWLKDVTVWHWPPHEWPGLCSKPTQFGSASHSAWHEATSAKASEQPAWVASPQPYVSA